MHIRMILIAALFCGGCSEGWHCPFAPKPCPAVKSVSAADLGTKVQVIGRLGRPLGTMVTIRGQAVQPVDPNNQSSAEKVPPNLFRVQSVDGQTTTPVDIEIILPVDEKFPANGPAGWMGYEDGSFEGAPTDAANGSQPASRSFITKFHALQPAAPEPAPSAPGVPPGQFG